MPKLTMSMTPYAMQRTAAYREEGAAPAPFVQNRRLGPPHYTDGQIVRGGAFREGYEYSDRLAMLTGTPVRFPPAGQAAAPSPYTTARSYTNGPTLLAASLAFAAGYALDHFLRRR